MTVAQAAEFLGCNPSQVRRLYRDGVLPGRRIGARLLLIDGASVRAYSASGKRGGWPRGRPRKKGVDDALPE